MKILFFIVILFSVPMASATAISLSKGEYWLNECSGISKDRTPQEAKDRCELMLVSYLMGVVSQAHHSGRKPVYCDGPPGKLSAQVVSYLKDNKSELEVEFLDVLHRFFSKNCKSQLKAHNQSKQ